MVTMSKSRRLSRAGQGDNPWPARLRAIRERHQISQREAAEKIGVALRTWQNWEYGRAEPTSATAKLIDILFPEPPR